LVTSTITSPTNGGSANTLTFSGTASGGTGIASVGVSVRQGSGNYWGGSAFDSGTEGFIGASGTAAWSCTMAAPAPDGPYPVRSRAVDTASDQQATPASSTFTLDGTGPTVASVTSPAEGTNFSAGTGPSSFAGTAADNSGGAGLSANSTTYT